jgi:hypothetical protein
VVDRGPTGTLKKLAVWVFLAQEVSDAFKNVQSLGEDII